MEILVIIHFRTWCLPVCLKLLKISVYKTILLQFVLLGYKTSFFTFKDKNLKVCWRSQIYQIVIVFYRNDSDGEFLRVNYSQPQRDSHFSVPLDQVIPWYEAHAAFTEAIYNPENTVHFKLKEGMSALGMPFFTFQKSRHFVLPSSVL